MKSYAFKSSLLFLGHQVGVKATMTPFENLSWFFALNGAKAAEANQNTPVQITQIQITQVQIESALAKVGLTAYRDVPCYQLSAGQQRRVALARLWISKAPLWILDEPFTAIDKTGVTDLERQIESHADDGGIVILTTHQAWQSNKVKVLNLEHFKPSLEVYDD